jgi:thiosulfate/3-mercaptopyruvate sulfurtransferase
LETATPTVVRGKIKPTERKDLVVSYAELHDLSARPAGAPPIIDARSSQHFSGPGAGHIPGARNVYWVDTLDSSKGGVLKSVDTIRGMYANAGVKPGSTPVVYCNSGMQASHAYFTLKWLGYEPRLYDGSFHDWVRHPDAPVEGATTK